MSAPVSTLATTDGQVDVYKMVEDSTNRLHETLHCQCPKCVHLEDGPPWGRDQMAARGIVQTEDDGATKYVYRFHKGSEIYQFWSKNGAGGSAICAECHAASKEEARAAWWRECVRAMCGGEADADAQVDFRRVAMLETINDNFYAEGDKLAEIVERGKGGALAQDADAADAQRKERVKRRHAEALVAKKDAASKEVDRANAEALLALYRNGCTVDPDGKEEDESVEVGDEDGDKAKKLYTEGEGNMNELRAQCPNYANRWLGRAPTDEELAAQASLVERLTAEATAAKQKFEAFEGEVKELEAQLVQDMEEEAFADDAPKKGRGKGAKKSLEEMTLEEAVKAEEKKRRDAETRKKNAQSKREMLGEYHELKAKAGKVEEAQRQLAEERQKRETLKQNATGFKRALDDLEANNKKREEHVAKLVRALEKREKKLEKVHDALHRMKTCTIKWMEDPKGKPQGWDAKKQFGLYEACIRDQKIADEEAAGDANDGDANA